LALCSILARLLHNDVPQIEKYFGASALGQRDKWGRKDYRDRTIAKAIGGKEPQPARPGTSGYEPISGTADQITPKKIVWLWSNRFAQKLNLIVGNPDEGKGLITYYIAACCTTGRDWFDATNMVGPSEVLLLNGEEDWDDTVVPRLMAAGADRSKVRWLKMSASKDGKIKEKELQLDRDISALENFLEEHPTIRLVVVDPVSNYLGNAKMIDEQKIREVLTPLKEIANRRQITVICVMHLNKKVELDAIHRIGGAMAFVGVARMVWLVAPKLNEDGTASDESLMVKVKGNIVQRNLKGLSFKVNVNYVPIEGEQVAVPYVEWVGDVEQKANEVTGKSQKPAHRPAEQLPTCMAWLRHYLRDGAKLLVEDIEPAGKALHGFSSKTIQRAREGAGIITFESGKRTARDGKKYPSYSCRLNAQDEANYSQQIADEEQIRFS
jgi:putative DNA primase/helicase